MAEKAGRYRHVQDATEQVTSQRQVQIMPRVKIKGNGQVTLSKNDYLASGGAKK
jgi:hypothetical protein